MTHTHIERNGTGSVVQGGTGKARTEGKTRRMFGALILLTTSCLLLITSAVAGTVYSGNGLTLSLSDRSMEAAVTWQDPASGRFLVGSGPLKSSEFGSIGLASTSTMQKVAAGGIGKVAAGGIGKVAAGGIGKVAAGGIGKVAAGGIGKGKEDLGTEGRLDFLTTDTGMVAVLTVSTKGQSSEYVFELSDDLGGSELQLIDEFHMN